MNKRNRPVQAFAGYLADLARIAAGRPVIPHSLSKLKILLAASKDTGARTLIEIGTFRGVTTARCAPHFDRVFTIEIDQTLYLESKNFLARWKNVECLKGDGRTLLPEILKKADVRDVLIFLDGHFSGGITSQSDIPEPAIEELESLAKFKNKISAIVIDDFRTFGTQDGVPSKSILMKTIEMTFPEPEYRTVIHLDQIILSRNQKVSKAA